MHRHGFTLVELLITIAVIVILASLILPKFTTVVNNARIARTYNTVSQVSTAWILLIQDTRSIPNGIRDMEYVQMATNNTVLIKEYFEFDRISNKYGILGYWGIREVRNNPKMTGSEFADLFPGHYVWCKINGKLQGAMSTPEGPTQAAVPEVNKTVLAWAADGSKKGFEAKSRAKADITSW